MLCIDLLLLLLLFAGRGRLFNGRHDAFQEADGCVLEAIGRDENVTVIRSQRETASLEFSILNMRRSKNRKGVSMLVYQIMDSRERGPMMNGALASLSHIRSIQPFSLRTLETFNTGSPYSSFVGSLLLVDGGG